MLVASLALLVLAPLLAVIWALVRLDSRGPAIYRGVRVGQGRPRVHDVQVPHAQTDAETRLGPYLGAELSRLTEDETTRVGRRLRAAHLDELPQLVNVLAGDMSLVGPRPIRPAFFEELCEQIPQYWQRLVVPPGMTGFAQLRMTREMTWEEKLAHDLEYIADRSPRLYLGVVVETAALDPAPRHAPPDDVRHLRSRSRRRGRSGPGRARGNERNARPPRAG